MTLGQGVVADLFFTKTTLFSASFSEALVFWNAFKKPSQSSCLLLNCIKYTIMLCHQWPSSLKWEGLVYWPELGVWSFSPSSFSSRKAVSGSNLLKSFRCSNKASRWLRRGWTVLRGSRSKEYITWHSRLPATELYNTTGTMREKMTRIKYQTQNRIFLYGFLGVCPHTYGHTLTSFLLSSFRMMCLSRQVSFNSLVDLLRASAAQGSRR